MHMLDNMNLVRILKVKQCHRKKLLIAGEKSEKEQHHKKGLLNVGEERASYQLPGSARDNHE